jgi:hypothetical protein
MKRGVAFKRQRYGGKLPGGDREICGMRWIHGLTLAVIVIAAVGLNGA